MSLSTQRYVGIDQQFNPQWLEKIVLQLGDAFEIRIKWDTESALVAGVCALAGGVAGGYAGGRLGAALGAGVGGVAGLTVSAMVSLRDLWTKIKDQLQELLYIVFNYIRQLDPEDYINALQILMGSTSRRRELAFCILEVIATKLGRQVISSLTM